MRLPRSVLSVGKVGLVLDSRREDCRRTKVEVAISRWSG